MADEKNNISNLNEINLSDIDWNKLSIREFHIIEKNLQTNQKIIKDSQEKLKRNSGTVIVKIRGKNYEIKEILYQRLKAMKSTKSKEKLVDDIISSHNPFEDLA